MYLYNFKNKYLDVKIFYLMDFYLEFGKFLDN